MNELTVREKAMPLNGLRNHLLLTSPNEAKAAIDMRLIAVAARDGISIEVLEESRRDAQAWLERVFAGALEGHGGGGVQEEV